MTKRVRSTKSSVLTLAGLIALLAGCDQAPAYRPSILPAVPAFKEAGPWVPAAPSIAATASRWWEAFGDQRLDALETRLNADNPALAEALARWREARAALGELRSAEFPQVSVGANVTANRQSNNRPLRGSNQPDLYDADTLGGEAGYELDLWGRVRDRVAGGRAQAEASADDAAALRLSLEAELARDYIALGGLDREDALLSTTVMAYAKADQLTRNRFAGGIADGIDVGRSGAQLADAQSQLAEVQDQRARLEHAIAALVGATASSFSLPRGKARFVPIAPPDTLPSTLIERRPDVAAAERRMFAANRAIGVARAAFFPSLMLGGGGGFQSTALAGLLAAPNLFWSVGPSVTLPLFDGGRHHARLAEARAQWDEATSIYRGTSLAAFREVEDGLSQAHYLGDEVISDDQRVVAATQAARLSWNRYVKGVANYLDVVTAQTSELAARRHAIDVETRQAQANVSLVRALGGGWEVIDPARK